ncbi:MAG TPA: winged helix-turn-helix transcriptional regulator [Solirubrobacteraceae bacterium]|nr:winged helix-turn-helix transcriptional regulator [Solirubrobacteraceae bacterium]
MAERKRNYGDSCGIARALDLVGERWTLLVIRELVLGPKRFTDLRAGLPGISADVLSQRLRELDAAGVVGRRALSPPASARVYELTDWGRELEPALHALGRWGSQAALPAEAPPLSADAAVVALQTMFDPAGAGEIDGAYELRLGDRPFTIRIGNRRLRARQGTDDGAVATIVTDTGTLVSVLWHGRPLGEAIASGSLSIDGDRAAAQRLLGSFSGSSASLNNA